MSRIQGNLKERTIEFGLKALNAMSQLPNEPRAWVVSKQFGRPATPVGANVWEADGAHTDAEFAYKMSIARKEAQETIYWLELMPRVLASCRHMRILAQGGHGVGEHHWHDCSEDAGVHSHRRALGQPSSLAFSSSGLGVLASWRFGV